MLFIVPCLLALVAVYVSPLGTTADENHCYASTQILLGRMLNLEQEVAELKKVINYQKTESQENKYMIIQLKRQNEFLNKTVKDLKMEFVKVRGMTSNLNNTVPSVQLDIAEIKDIISDLNNTLLDLQTKSFLLEKTNKDINRTVLALQEETIWKGLNKTLIALQAKLSLHNIYEIAQNMTLLQLKTAVARLERSNEDIHKAVEDLELGFTTMETQNKGLNAAMRLYEKELHATPTVTFKARLSQHVNLTIEDDVLIFDEVLRDTFDAYNESTGVFVAPVNGSYLCSVTALSYHAQSAHLEVVKNVMTELGRFFTGHGPNTNTGTEIVVVDLQKGDEVCVRKFSGLPTYRAQIHGGNWTNFVGVLLSLY